MTDLAVRASNDELARLATRIGEEVAGPASDSVDQEARFPHEAIHELASHGMLAALIPPSLGGGGASLGTVAACTATLARSCASTAMIHAMHQLMVACLVRHGDSPYFQEYLRQVGREQLLVASATTEVGIGGDTRSSGCAVIEAGGQFVLDKQAPVISYGEHAAAILVTARRTPESPPNDQVMVLCRPPELTLDPLCGWDALGFRGTCSSGFSLHAAGPTDAILPHSFGDISAQTMLPVAHILWSHVWLGIAAEATERARRWVQGEARKHPGTSPSSAVPLAELVALYRQLSALVRGAASQFDERAGDLESYATLDAAVAMNSLKVSASTLVVEVVTRAMRICGMAAYRLDSPFSMGRLLRDAHGAALMVSNDRILMNNAQLLLMDRTPI